MSLISVFLIKDRILSTAHLLSPAWVRQIPVLVNKAGFSAKYTKLLAKIIFKNFSAMKWLMSKRNKLLVKNIKYWET